MKKNWFTFIEVLVAIVVFSIWVFAVLGLLTSNLKWMDRNDLRLQWTLFAKEWLELVYNMRDSNLERELPWNCIVDSSLYGLSQTDLWGELAGGQTAESNRDPLDKICSWYFNSVSALKISYSDTNYIIAESTNLWFSGNQLYKHTWENLPMRYSYESNWWEQTVFSRYITFTWITESIPWKENYWFLLNTWKILKVSSHVLWQRWSTTWEVVLDSFIWNY